MASFAAKLLSSSSNVKSIGGHAYEFETVDKILPGDRVEVVLKVELNDTAFTEVWPIVRFNFGYLKDVDHKNNVVRLPIKVVEKSTSTSPTTPSSTGTTTPTITTTPAVAKAGNNSGLASTGASVLGFLGLGALLLAGGLGALFVARRRRS
jgi:LPXTG-motif cell wall-anchored protein